MKHRLTVLLFAVLVLALAGFTGAAFAGGGNGNGGSASSGNSASAPGHQDQSAPAPAPAAAANATPAAKVDKVAAKAAAKVAAKADVKADASAKVSNGNSAHTSSSIQTSSSVNASTQSSASPCANPATGGDNSHGVKPSNTTQHNTCAAAASDKTKLYGNGKTAGQIATQAGYGTAVLHGPGNSQPHKTTPCPGGKHEVDVHALKHKAGTCGTAAAVVTPEVKVEATCTTITRTVTERVLVANTKVRGKSALHASVNGKAHANQAKYETVIQTLSVPTGANCQSTQPTVISTQVVSNSSVTTGTAAPASVGVTAAPATSASAPLATSTPKGAVKGAVVALKPTKAAKTKPAGGVLGATTRLGHSVSSGRLPFTGLPLWIFALVAAGLIAVGAAARQTASRRI